jgi:hypothetical protein
VVTVSDGLCVEGRIFPELPFVEVTEQGQALNFDAMLTNRGERTVELTRLEVTFVGDRGDILTRRLDNNGDIPSIEVVPRRQIPPHQSQQVFNPVECAPVEAAVVTVRVATTLSGRDSSTFIELAAPVRRWESSGMLLPMAGRVWVWDGHDQLSHHRRWDYTQPWAREQGIESNPMRYAYDLVAVDDRGRHHDGDGVYNEDYFGFGLPVRAPAAGRIVEVSDHRPDDGSWDAAASVGDPNSPLGNRVIIAHADQTFSHLAHIRQGSATVALGEQVEAGDELAAVGNSGSSLFPHLHYQRVDAATMRGEGVPSTFIDIILDGGIRVAAVNGHIDSGDILQAR